MNLAYIVPAILIIFTISMFFTVGMFTPELEKFCKENGFEYSENYDSSHACWKDTPTKLLVKKIKCTPDWLSVFTFRNPYRGCKFSKQVEVI